MDYPDYVGESGLTHEVQDGRNLLKRFIPEYFRSYMVWAFLFMTVAAAMASQDGRRLNSILGMSLIVVGLSIGSLAQHLKGHNSGKPPTRMEWDLQLFSGRYKLIGIVTATLGAILAVL